MILTDFTPRTSPEPKRFVLSPHQKVLLMPLGDIHYGSEGWPEERFRAHIRWGVERGAYFLGMGEYIDFTSASQRSILRNLRESQQESLDDRIRAHVEFLGDILKPTAGRWIGLLEGDHYHQYADGTTSDQHLCRILQAPFLGTSSLIRIRLELSKRHYEGCDLLIYAHHGFGGGRLAGSGLNMLEKLLPVIEADIYLMGHNHTKVNAPLDRLYITPYGHLYHRRKIFARTGGWLVGYFGKAPQHLTEKAQRSRGTYIEKRALQPSTLGGLVFSLGYKRETHPTSRGDIVIPDIHYSV